ncbi:uncharacterized protein LACBIDRAFT_298639 [Laccaria bicolor S238N-H82]|uniref:Predicted protein n=1 Tax=Laccaria bicolor (strain S238N-H82 / ATCC MYA-4686) TaxID=486041 RepID=B0DDA1_LACBS|nr:uncharacterized protein LACBIDRAFT_298639 [Laccaria bicolor S238N-H82]EDR07573.1 predicted protein [Laccaria bicolor S238N-H82]|eukprot:XP_001881965.1 predicted protein [Laccaria bicolor S238N-H82]
MKLPVGLSTMLTVTNSIGSALTSSTNIAQPLRKKALLIGINYPEGTDWNLRGPQNEVREFRELLLTQGGYQDANIVVLTDAPGTQQEYLPTRANILREIMRLTAGSSPGDEHFLLYSGHSAQRKESEKRETPPADTTNTNSNSAVPQITDNNTTTITNATTSECSTALANTSLPNWVSLPEYTTVQRTISTRTAHTTTTIETSTLGLSEEDAIEADLLKFVTHFSSSDSAEEEEEEDGYDEYIIPLDAISIGPEMKVVDEKIILDDILRQCLVLPLFPQAKLVAIFDCCHSATLLDLKHHRCHRIGTWPSRFRRFCRRFFVEPYARIVLPFKSHVLRKIEPTQRPEDTDRPEESTDPTYPKPDLKSRPHGRFSGLKALGKKASTGKPAASPLPRQSSFNIVINPRKRCSGLCARMDLSSLDRQHVVCVSACKDSQMGVENKAGESMTEAIIDLLKENPRPTLRQLMQAVNANTKRQRKKMKEQYENYEKKIKSRGRPPSQKELKVIEEGKDLCQNMQNPQISSSRSLDLRKTYLFGPSDVSAPDHERTQGWKGGQRFKRLLPLFRRGRAQS